MVTALANAEVGPEMLNNTSHVAGPITLQSSSRSLNSDTYSGFFSGTSFSQSDLNESVLLSRQEIKLLKKQKIGCSSGQCSICFDKYSKGEVIRSLPCGHKFHYKCMKPWLRTQSFCPLCRFDLKAYCSQKIEAQTCHQILEEGADLVESGSLGAAVDVVPKKDVDLHSKTFIEAEATDHGKNLLGQNIDISAIEMENGVDHSSSQQILENEKLLRLRVMGCETESNVSFFCTKQESKQIYFGIEDDISEIGL